LIAKDFFSGFQSPFGMQNSFMNQPFQQNSFMQQSFDQNSFTRQPFGQNSFTQQPFQQPTYTPPPQPPATNPTNDLDSFSTAESREEALQNLLAMGFDRSQVEKALKACLYNVNAALDYLTSVLNKRNFTLFSLINLFFRVMCLLKMIIQHLLK